LDKQDYHVNVANKKHPQNNIPGKSIRKIKKDNNESKIERVIKITLI
jgi:hypothetical protein